MKKIIALLMLFTVLVVCGCTQAPSSTASPSNSIAATPTPSLAASTATPSPTLPPTPSASVSTISSDIDSIANEISGIDVNGTGDAIIPVTADELDTD